MPGGHAGGDGLISALRGGGLEPERGGQAAELARAVAKHGIKARARLGFVVRKPSWRVRSPSTTPRRALG